uniref:Uncharacterized protein n=1 Tax=Rhizophora mucronata TaxID=61149 RepID=A0A2P2N038_RHIMU
MVTVKIKRDACPLCSLWSVIFEPSRQ